MTRRPFTWVICRWSNRSSCRWHDRCRPLLQTFRLRPDPDGDGRGLGSARDGYSRRDHGGGLPLCTAQNIGVSIDVLGGTAAVVVRHVWGRPCDLAPLTVRLGVTDLVGRRVRLASLSEGPVLPSHIEGDFAPGFEALIDIPYLAKPQLMSCASRGPFTAFVIVGPYSAQRKLSGSEVGCFRGG
jgi:hypothetical protein